MLAKPVARGLDLPVEAGAGLDYHHDAGADPAGTWKGVLAALVAAGRDAAAGAALVAAAVATVELLYSRHAVVVAEVAGV